MASITAGVSNSRMPSLHGGSPIILLGIKERKRKKKKWKGGLVSISGSPPCPHSVAAYLKYCFCDWWTAKFIPRANACGLEVWSVRLCVLESKYTVFEIKFDFQGPIICHHLKTMYTIAIIIFGNFPWLTDPQRKGKCAGIARSRTITWLHSHELFDVAQFLHFDGDG
jgi:hypothetical protein